MSIKARGKQASALQSWTETNMWGEPWRGLRPCTTCAEHMSGNLLNESAGSLSESFRSATQSPRIFFNWSISSVSVWGRHFLKGAEPTGLSEII